MNWQIAAVTIMKETTVTETLWSFISHSGQDIPSCGSLGQTHKNAEIKHYKAGRRMFQIKSLPGAGGSMPSEPFWRFKC